MYKCISSLCNIVYNLETILFCNNNYFIVSLIRHNCKIRISEVAWIIGFKDMDFFVNVHLCLSIIGGLFIICVKRHCNELLFFRVNPLWFTLRSDS